MFKSLRFKFIILITIAMIISMGIGSTFVIVDKRRYLYDGLLKKANLFGLYTANSIYTFYSGYYIYQTDKDFEKFKELVNETLAKNREVIHAVLIDTTGKMLFDSLEFSQGRYRNAKERIVTDEKLLKGIKEVQARVSKGVLEPLFGRIILYEGKKVLELLCPVALGDLLTSVVVYHVSLESIYKAITNTTAIILGISVGVISLGIILAIFLANIIILPIDKLTKGVKRISTGDLNYKVSVTTKDEIGMLADSFNKMTEDLQKTTVSIKVLEEEQRRFQNVTQSTGDWIWEVDDQGRYTYSSAVVEKILRYKSEEIIGKHFYDFFHPDDREELKKAALETFAKKESFKDFPNRNVRKDGQVVILEITAVPIADENGRLLGYRGADRDVTERKKTEEEREALINELKERERLLSKQKQELENSQMAIKNVAEDLRRSKEALEAQKGSLEDINKELDDFTYIVSHDLKEPLRSIDAFSKFLEDDYQEKIEEEGKGYIKRIRANTTRMQNLIEDLLEISRIERKRSSLEEVDAEGLLGEVRLRLEYAIKEKNAEIVIQDNLPKIFCDRVRLVEVFVNLVSNAIKFNDKPNPKIEVGCNAKVDHYEFFVKDNGPGIEEQYFQKIFEIFQRLGKREDAEGTGAGLTIVKKIIEMHKGKIWLESKVDEYTIFYFTIPKRKQAILGKKKLGEILVEKKLVTEEEIKKALDEQKETG